MSAFEFDFNLDEPSGQPKYLRIAQIIEDHLSRNDILPGTRLPSERQLSRAAGVTCVTINRSLNELAARGVLCRKVGSGTYVAGPECRCCIGIVCDRPFSFSDYYIGQVLNVFHQYWLRSADLIHTIASPEQYGGLIERHHLAGLLILSVQESFVPEINRLRQAGHPVVTIGAAIRELDGISFGTNHQESCRQAVLYLRRHRCRRIALLTSRITNTAILERERGYTKAMYEAGLPLDPDWIIRKESPGEKPPEKTIADLMRRRDRPDAVLLANYHDIQPFYELMHRLELRIPEDISVIGFDDPDYASTISPPLTVLRQPIEEITRQAAQQLEQQIKYHRLGEFNRCNSILVERDSCLPA